MSIPTHEEIYRLQQLSRVKNTDKCTSKWLRVVDRFNKEANMTKKINQYDTSRYLKEEVGRNCTSRFINSARNPTNTNHSTMNGEDNKSLIRRVFFWISLLCGLQGGDAYKIEDRQLTRRKDGGLNLEH
ncbi:hypothetical protein GLOIN_2v1482044 [Rhizophagus clarus]|uniref:Uncharacterized protein n=1 Tax=Rhizophagus clarus TaxID=94130 RepID=A0A8H3KRI8_9GLOM|nr:hypothetical protein GLOIN_2v1482044 [Rhizophagus clarus]